MPHPPPPDFRYVGLSPGPSASGVALAAAGASTGVASAVLVATAPETTSIVATLTATGLAAFALVRRRVLAGVRRLGAAPTAMAIVPWGVLVEPDGEATRVVRWAGVRSVSVDSVHTRDVGGTPSTSHSLVFVETARERLVGRAEGLVGLERLVAHLRAYAEESAAPVAYDLDGAESGPPSGTEPVLRALLSRARDLVGLADGATRLSLSQRSYRQVSAAAPTVHTVETLRAALRQPGDAADRRAIAALVAAELGLSELVPELLRLVTAAHPVVAAAAKASALRLGVEPTRAGSLDEVAPFLDDDDVDALAGWIVEPASG